MGKKFDIVDVLEGELGTLSFGAILKAHRQLLGLTQEQIGLQIGVTKQTVNDYESGRHIPTLKKALEIGSKIGLSDDYIVTAVFTDMLVNEGKAPLVKKVLNKAS